MRWGAVLKHTRKALLQDEEACLLHRGLGRVEFFDYPLDAMQALREHYSELAAKGRPGLSFHAPMPRPKDYRFSGITCFFLNERAEHREISFRAVEETLRHARDWSADYVVTHLTFGKADTANPETAVELAADACERLARMSRRYEIPINIEFAAYTRAFNDPRHFVQALSEHPELGICLDTGHAMLGARLHGRDYLDDIRILAPHTRSMHLWNTKDGSGIHTPLHPSQSPADGWIDVGETLRTVLTHNPRTSIIFEYPVTKVTPDIQAGYDWIGELVTTLLTANLSTKAATERNHV